MSRSIDCPECPMKATAHRLARRLSLALAALDRVASLLPSPLASELDGAIESLSCYDTSTPAGVLEIEIVGDVARKLADEHPDILRVAGEDDEEVRDE